MDSFIIDLLSNVWKAKILVSAIELKLFSTLNEGPQSASNIALQLGIGESYCQRLLDALSLFPEKLIAKEDNMYSNSPLSSALREQEYSSLIILEIGPVLSKLWPHLTQLLKEGKQNAFPYAFGVAGPFQLALQDPNHLKLFQEAMQGYTLLEAPHIVSLIDFSPFKSVLDIGGGTGHLVHLLKKSFPTIQAECFDLPFVVQGRFFEDVVYHGGDFFDTSCQIPACEAFILKNVLHDWNDDQAIAILKNIRKSAMQSSKLFIIEYIKGDTEAFPYFADLHMMLVTEGKERTADDFIKLLAASGWKLAKKCKASSYPLSVIIGHPI